MTGMRKLDTPKGHGRSTRHSNRLEQLYKLSKCRDCSVDVIRMDFKKMMGKFTKVKIQYENTDAVSSPVRSRVRTRKGSEPEDINVATRLRSNENGMVLIHRKAYQKHPVKSAGNKDYKNDTRSTSNVLRERNSQLSKKALELLARTRKSINLNGAHPSPLRVSKQYYLVFTEPKGITKNLRHTKPRVFKDLLIKMNNTILPNNGWVVDFSPIQKNEQDVVYDRIAAELEGLMPSEKTPVKDDSKGSTGVDARGKIPEDFPSIMDILNEEPMSVDPDKPTSKSEEPRTNDIQTSDIEAMLTGSNDSESTPALTVGSTNANEYVTVSPKKSTDNKSKSITEVTKNTNILSTNEIVNELLTSDSDPKDIAITTKDITESVNKNILNDEAMDIDETEQESDISVKKSADETIDVTVTNNDCTSLQATDNLVKEGDVEDKKATSPKKAVHDPKEPAIDEDSATTKPEVAMESVQIEEKMQQNEINSEKTCESTESKPREEYKIIEVNDSSKEKQSPENVDIKMETNGMESEDAASTEGIVDGCSKVQDVKEEKTAAVVVKQEDLSPIIPEHCDLEIVTHITFKRLTDTNGSRSKTVTFRKSFDYDIEIEGKRVQLIGAPESINDIEDLKVLLQIVDETGLNSFNISH